MSAENTESTVLTLRKLEIARKFPLLSEQEPSRRSDEPQACQRCGQPMQRVVITTGGAHGDPAVWEAYPLAFDGWRCQPCQQLVYPAFLSPDEINELQDSAVRWARNGELDQAELLLRRCVSSWPRFSPPLVNLASVHLDKIRREQSNAGRPEIIQRWALTARDLLDRALTGEPPPPAMVYLMLGRIESRLGNTARSDELLQQFLAFEDVAGPLRAEARALLKENAASS